MPYPQVAHVFAAGNPSVFNFNICAHFNQRGDQSGARWIEHDILDGNIRTLAQKGRNQGKSRRRRIARNINVLGRQFALAFN